MQSETKLPFRRALTRFAIWFGLSIALLALVVVVAALVLRAAGSKRRDAALEQIRARGEPMRMTDGVPPPRGGGEDPVAWLREFDKIPYVEVDPRELAACAEVVARGESGDEFFERLDARVCDPTATGAPTPCDAELLHRRVALNAASLEQALTVDRYATIDWARFLANDGTIESLVPQAPVPGAISVVRSLSQAAVDSALHGDSTQAVHRLELALRAARLFDDSPFMIGHLCWILCDSIVLNATARVAGLLPRATDLDALATEFATIEPHVQLRRAMLGERAFGMQIFASFRNGTTGLEGFTEHTSFARCVQRIWFEHDEADYLEAMERAVDAASQPHAPAGDVAWDPRFYSIVSPMILPRWGHYITATVKVEAQLLVTRAALVAHRDGFDAARAWASTQRDPFGGQPLHTRVDADGALSIWSIGDNLVDDGAPLPPWKPEDWDSHIPPDILVRCAMR